MHPTDTMSLTIHQPNGIARGESQTQSFGSLERRASAELAAVHQAAVAEAMIKARYTMALTRPSDFLVVRSKLLKDCERPTFAATAWYAKPVGGGKIEGPSIRFAEAFMRARGNMVPEVMVVHDDADQRILRVALTDLESNTTLSIDRVLVKTVERKNGSGREIVGMRGATCIVRAYDDELADKEGSIVSKALRGLILRLCPGDLLDEAKATVFRTRANGAAADPDKAWRALVDDFEIHLRIKPAMLAEYLGHPADTATPDEIVGLQSVYAAIKDGAAKWSDYINGEEPAPKPSDVRASVLKAAGPASAPAVVAEARRMTEALDAHDAAEDARRERLQAQAKTQPDPKPTQKEQSEAVESRRKKFAALIRDTDETEESARKRAVDELGKVTAATFAEWIENADQMIRNATPTHD